MAYDDIPFEDFSEDRVHGARRHKLRRFLVVDDQGEKHEVTAHFAFNNGEEGLVFRRYRDRSDRTAVVASWGNGFWKFYKEIEG